MSDKQPANPEERKAYLEALKAGRLEFSDQAARALANLDLDNPNKTLTQVTFRFWGAFKDKDTGRQINQGGLGIDWETVSAGCGRCDFYIDNNGKLHCMNQCESREFILGLLFRMLDEAVLEHRLCPFCNTYGMEDTTGEFRFEPPEEVPGGTIVVPNATWQECCWCKQQILPDPLTKALESAVSERTRK